MICALFSPLIHARNIGRTDTKGNSNIRYVIKITHARYIGYADNGVTAYRFSRIFDNIGANNDNNNPFNDLDNSIRKPINKKKEF